MIYKNFLYFIIAVVLFTVAPSTKNPVFSPLEDLLSILLLILLFSHVNKISFLNLKKIFKSGEINKVDIKKKYRNNVDRNSFIALLFFSVELFVFDLKSFLTIILKISGIETFVNISMVIIFLFHLVLIWYWGFKFLGKLIRPDTDSSGYISENIKFNMVILIPWLGITILTDILNLLKIDWIVKNSSSPLFQFVFLLIFLFLFLLLSPSLVVRLWNCSEMEDGTLKRLIINYSRREGIEFKKILHWNAFGGDIVTAAVIGFFKNFRYLLITPGLNNMLTEDEVIAVVSHETGHVKKKHMLFYLLLFIGFIVIGGGLITVLEIVFLNTQIGIDVFLASSGMSGIGYFNIATALISIAVFILYFRYIFGFFMRNFEREADLFCFESGVDPGFLESAFRKIRAVVGSEKKGSNWHHFTIGERIEFLNRCSHEPDIPKKHKKKLRIAITVYSLILLIIAFLTIYPSFGISGINIENKIIINVLKRKIEKSPGDSRLYALLASIYYEQSRWIQARLYYKKSLSINSSQPEILNNLAWLLVTCKDENVRSPKRGLDFAIRAVRLKSSAHIYDTLAEAYLVNEQYENAFKSSYNALKIATDNYDYYKKQLLKMKKLFERDKKILKI